MDKLLALRMFIDTVDANGFSAAARAAGVATSSVTRMVDALESELGTVLLNRSTRQISVTEAGADYYGKARAILEAVCAADAQVSDRGEQAVGLLRVCLPVAFGRRVVAPQVQLLLARHPGLDIDITLSDEISNLLSERIDVSIRLGSILRSEDIVSRKIGQFERWLVASPDYLSANPLLTQPLDLHQHQCLKFDYGAGSLPWTLQGQDETIELEVRGRLKSNNADLLHEAVLAGAGIALLADWLVKADVENGRLVRVLEQYQVSPGQTQTTINALYLPNHRGSTRVNTFINFLEKILANAS
ncbi:LysR family transcriptional regulator [Pseudomonas segetis]|uniref:Transcriptional regulator, LysR family n=1 Tax=Pseudomonas segetis TaxID=298908 RepID=A0A239INK3_9PSED|nr:LysR family transcriptional regulator [Pseudomonas segetis]SNS95240.1 transcriptional regulator, LysR family [Pseudomonas segetis]